MEEALGGVMDEVGISSRCAHRRAAARVRTTSSRSDAELAGASMAHVVAATARRSTESMPSGSLCGDGCTGAFVGRGGPPRSRRAQWSWSCRSSERCDARRAAAAGAAVTTPAGSASRCDASRAACARHISRQPTQSYSRASTSVRFTLLRITSPARACHSASSHRPDVVAASQQMVCTELSSQPSAAVPRAGSVSSAMRQRLPSRKAIDAPGSGGRAAGRDEPPEAVAAHRHSTSASSAFPRRRTSPGVRSDAKWWTNASECVPSRAIAEAAPARVCAHEPCAHVGRLCMFRNGCYRIRCTLTIPARRLTLCPLIQPPCLPRIPCSHQSGLRLASSCEPTCEARAQPRCRAYDVRVPPPDHLSSHCLWYH